MRKRVRVAGQETTSFEMQSGVRQGDSMSPTLFNYAIDFVLKRALRSLQGVQVGTIHFLLFLFDDSRVNRFLQPETLLVICKTCIEFSEYTDIVARVFRPSGH